MDRDAYIEQQKYYDERDNARQESLDKRTVAAILRTYGKSKKPVFASAGDNISLAWLWDKHPDAPIKLIAKHVYRWSLVDLFTRPTKSPIFEAFEDAVDSFSDEDNVGAVFHADTLGDMVIHNWNEDNMTFGSRIVVPSACYGWLTIQQLKNFLPILRGEWVPTGYPLGA